MTRRYLLDTSILSEPAKERPDGGLLRRLESHWTEVATAAPVWHELRFGVERLAPSRRRADLERYLARTVADGMPILPYDAEAARWHAAERARLAAAGRALPFVDGQIAAVARVSGLVLVTANVRDFADLEGLVVVNWIGG